MTTQWLLVMHDDAGASNEKRAITGDTEVMNRCEWEAVAYGVNST